MFSVIMVMTSDPRELRVESADDTREGSIETLLALDVAPDWWPALNWAACRALRSAARLWSPPSCATCARSGGC